jgi:hypothetical protein
VSWARPKHFSSLFPYPQEHRSSPRRPCFKNIRQAMYSKWQDTAPLASPIQALCISRPSTMSFIPSMSISIGQPFVYSTSRRRSRSNLSIGYGHTTTSSGFAIPRPRMLRSSPPLCKRCASITRGPLLFFGGFCSSITDFIPASSRRSIPSSRSPASLSSSGPQVISLHCAINCNCLLMAYARGADFVH